MKGTLIASMAAVAWAAITASAATLRVTTSDASGAPLASTLLIVRSLEKPVELFRALTDKAGEVSPHDLDPGRYQVIATYPYGPWKTVVREFVVEKTPIAVSLVLPAEPTDRTGAAVGKKTRLAVLAVDGQARFVPGVAILVRDREATIEAWYQTNAKGEVALDVSNFDDGVVLVSFHGAAVTEREIPASEIATLTRKRGRVILRVV
jgi:hypothetical protein